MHHAIIATGLFEIGAVRVRAFCANHYAIADLFDENSFIDMNFRVGQGRNQDDLKRAGDTIFLAASNYLAKQFETPHFALSFAMQEINSALSWKKNAMHARLR